MPTATFIQWVLTFKQTIALVVTPKISTSKIRAGDVDILFGGF
jgi:hypothetical protein